MPVAAPGDKLARSQDVGLTMADRPAHCAAAMLVLDAVDRNLLLRGASWFSASFVLKL